MAIINPQITILVITLFVLTSCSQQCANNYLFAFKDTSTSERRWGFRTIDGEVIIQPKYEMIETDTMCNIAFVTLKYKWIAIDRNEKIILVPYIYDNGPDYIKEGLFRYVENNKIGFANKDGQKIITAAFDFVLPFCDGLAAFNVGGHSEDLDEEHSIWTGGLWGFIDKNGNIVIVPQFANVESFEGEHCEVWTKDGKHLLIDHKGNTVKEFTE